MPVEVRELVIKAVVDESGGKKNITDKKGIENLREEIITDCVEQVMRLLREQAER